MYYSVTRVVLIDKSADAINLVPMLYHYLNESDRNKMVTRVVFIDKSADAINLVPMLSIYFTGIENYAYLYLKGYISFICTSFRCFLAVPGLDRRRW